MRNSRRAGKPAGRKPEKQGLTGLFTKGKNIPTTAQQTLPYREMYRDGVCRVADRYYTKTIEYEDINYQLAQSEDQAAIFDGWSACLNYFDSSLPFQLSFLNHRSRPGSRYSVNIPMQDDDYNSVRCEYVEMLENQIAKSNNGIVRTKLLTFGVNVDDLSTARARLERVEADICGNFKKLGVKCRSLSGLERLELLHGQLHPGSGSPFRFSWDMIPKTGLSTKDFIAPDSFDFRFSRLFRVGTTWGAASYLQILASELSDKLLAELLEMDAEMTITLHIQTVDQAAAVKSIKAKVSDIDKMKVEEQKKAARSGYDMDILPPDLVTYSNDAKTLLEDLQSRNERMFLLTFLVVNMAPTRRELDNDLFTVSGIVQKYNCTLKRLDFQQEDGFLSSLPLGHNGIEIKRGMTTSSTAIFVPFMTQELRMDGEAVYYGLNALSHICGKGFTTAAKIPAPAMRYPARRWMTRLLRRSWKKPQSTSAGPMCGAAPARPPPLTVRALSAGCTRPAASTTCPVPRRRAFTTSVLSFLPPRQSPATLSFSREPMTAPALCPMWGFMWATG